MKLKGATYLAITCSVALFGCNQTQTTGQHQSERPVQVIRVGDTHNHENYKFTGTLESAHSADIAFRVPGLIEAIPVKDGQVVHKGQLLARLDPHDYQVTKAELKARLAEATAANKLANAELTRVKKALSDEAISPVSLDRATSGVERSAAMMEVVRQNIKKADDAIGYTRLKAPFDGVIGKVYADPFEQVTPGLTVMSIHQPDALEVQIEVPENLIERFKPGQSAKVGWYGAKQPIEATLVESATVPDPIKQTYRVTFQLAPQTGDVKAPLPGKSVVLTTRFPQSDNRYCLPYTALVGSGSDYHVFTIHENRAIAKAVVALALKAECANVSGDLDPQDYIVVAGASYLKEGDATPKIQIKEERE